MITQGSYYDKPAFRFDGNDPDFTLRATITDWCRELFGPEQTTGFIPVDDVKAIKGVWGIVHALSSNEYDYSLIWFFNNKSDAALFKLKWL